MKNQHAIVIFLEVQLLVVEAFHQHGVPFQLQLEPRVEQVEDQE
jgi:hypothetical protein